MFQRVPRLPTDLEILSAIYRQYYATYRDRDRASRRYVVIDIAKIARALRADEDIVRTRLFHHFDKTFSYKVEDEDGDTVYVNFAKWTMDEDDEAVISIQFPWMASILATLQEQHRTNRNNLIAAAVSAVGAILSAIFAALAIGYQGS